MQSQRCKNGEGFNMKEYWITNSRFKLLVILLMIIWLGFMLFLYLKADEISNSPCEICAKKMDKDVNCYIEDSGMILNRVYYPNLTYKDILT